jgi:hypothetical protein
MLTRLRSATFQRPFSWPHTWPLCDFVTQKNCFGAVILHLAAHGACSSAFEDSSLHQDRCIVCESVYLHKADTLSHLSTSTPVELSAGLSAV